MTAVRASRTPLAELGADVTRTAFVVTAVLLAAGPGRAAEPGLQIGMVQGMFRDVQPALVQAMSRPLQDMIRKQTGLTGDVEIVADAFVLADKIRDGRLQLGVFHGFEYAWVKARHPDLVPLAVAVPPGRMLQACVVVHADSKLSGLADLKGEQVVIPRGSKAHCYLYLDRQRAGLPVNCACAKTKPLVTAEEALDAVVNGDSPAALVDIAVLTGYQNLQPGAAKNLKVLCRSDAFPPGVIAYHRGSVDPVTVERMRHLLLTADRTPAGKPLIMLWNLKGFEDVPADYPARLDAILKAYPPPAASAPPAGDIGK